MILILSSYGPSTNSGSTKVSTCAVRDADRLGLRLSLFRVLLFSLASAPRADSSHYVLGGYIPWYPTGLETKKNKTLAFGTG